MCRISFGQGDFNRRGLGSSYQLFSSFRSLSHPAPNPCAFAPQPAFCYLRSGLSFVFHEPPIGRGVFFSIPTYLRVSTIQLQRENRQKMSTKTTTTTTSRGVLDVAHAPRFSWCRTRRLDFVSSQLLFTSILPWMFAGVFYRQSCV